LAETTARDTIYRKGSYVAMMLRRMLGDEIYFQALRQFLDRFRYQQVTDVELQQVLEEVSQQKLDPFFADWVRSDRLADLALDGASPTEATVNNLGPATVPGPIELWKFKKAGGTPERSTVQVGQPIRLTAEDDYAILDPLLAWADMQRENNRYPRHRDPLFVAAASGTPVATTVGEVFPWVRATLTSGGGDAAHTWDFERGFLQPPAWAPDGNRLVVSYADAGASLPSIISLGADGTRQRLGSGSAPAAGPDGVTYAVHADRLVKLTATGAEASVVRRAGFALDVPVPSPSGAQIAYTAARGNALEVRVVRNDGGDDRLLLPWDRDRTVLSWSRDGSRLYTLMGGNWDWQIWEVPLGFAPVRVLVRDAAAIGSLAVSPDGSQLAFTAAPDIDYPANRRQLYVLDLAAGHVRNIDIADADLSELTWLDDTTVLVVATAAGPDHPWTLPAPRTVKRVRLADESVSDFDS
jgi:hypothetical protein